MHPELELEAELEQLISILSKSDLESEREWEREAETEWGAQALCPAPTEYTVIGFPRYRYSGASLPIAEQQKLRHIAEDIIASYHPGCVPIATVHLVGHADRDFQRGREFEDRISRKRALGIRDTLFNLINYPPIAAQIRWTICSMGSRQLLVANPRNESERLLNRRVTISLSTAVPSYPVFTSVTSSGIGLAGCSPPPHVCHRLSLAVHSTDHGTYTANLFVEEPNRWHYLDSYSGVDIAGHYENGHGRGMSPTGTAFVDGNGHIVFFLDDFLPFNGNKYDPKSAFSHGAGRFITPPLRLKLATLAIEWKVEEVKDC